MNKGHRIQFVVDNILQAEAIVETFDEAERIYHALINLKWKRNKPFGIGSVTQLANKPRTYDVLVGTEIN